MKKRRHFLMILVAWVVLGTLSLPAHADEKAWRELKSGQAIAIMRHALAPGTGDPENFDVEDCSTQRNLSTAGRIQAKKIGDLFRQNGVKSARVLSSQWCRCLETAQLLNLGTVEALPAINSFFQDFSREGAQTVALKEWISQNVSSQPIVLVTHQVNITAYTGVYPRSGEVVIFRPNKYGEPEVLERIQTKY